MDFINSVETQALASIKKITEFKNIPRDDNWLDYRALCKALECGRKNVAMHLLSQNFRVNNETSSGTPTTTPLHYAVKLGDTELVEQLLAKEASLTAFDSENNTALHLAFIFKHNAIVDIMLSHMEKAVKYIECKNNQNLTHLHVACTGKYVNVIEGLLKAGASVTDEVAKDSFIWAGYTAMHFAVEYKSLEAVKILANASSHSDSSNQVTNVGSPLQILHQSLDDLLIMAYHLERKSSQNYHRKLSYFDVACLRSDEKLVKKFIDNGAQINDSVSSDTSVYPCCSPLHFAVESKCKENVDQLLHHGADVRYSNLSKITPLHMALYAEDSETNDTIVDRLYEALGNKDENLADDYNLSFFHVAVTRNDVETVKNFLDRSVDVNSKVSPNSHGFSNFTPLHFAVFYQHLTMAELLIERGAHVNANDEGNYGTPLQVACFVGNTSLIELLLRNNADVNVTLANGLSTPIHMLAEYYQNQEEPSCLDRLLTYVDQLARLGCDVNAQDSYGNTALHYISWEFNDSAPFARLLLEHGADVNLQNKKAYLPFDGRNLDKKRCNSEEYSLFYDHVQNLKALGMEVHSKNKECCRKVMLDGGKGEGTFSVEQLARRDKQRLDEIAKMKGTMITNYMRLYDFMLLDLRRAGVYANNEVLKGILEDKDFEVQYPTYYYLIRLQQQRGMKFRKF